MSNHFREPEIKQFGERVVPLGGRTVQQDDIFRLDVSVDDVHGMEVDKGHGDLLKNHPGFLFVVPLFLQDGVEEFGPLGVFEDEHEGLCTLKDTFQADDVWVV